MKKRIVKMFLLLIVIVLSTPLIVNFVVKNSVKEKIVTLEEAKEFDADAILVLGCLVRSDGQPSAMLKDRLDTALELGLDSTFIMSGDHGTKYYDEVNTMRNYAAEKGAKKERVFMDHAGFCTYDSIYRAKEIFSANKIVIVTQKYHLYRALYIAEKLGLEAVGVASDLHTYRGQINRELREVVARNKDFLFSHLKLKPKYLGDKIDLNGDAKVTEG